MPGNFGADFDATVPPDNDLVKYGASWIRDIKSRLKSFLAAMFNLDSGEFKDNVVESASLKDLAPSPAGQWKRVTVNEKGLVTQGDNPVDVITAKLYRAVFGIGGGGIDNDTGYTTVSAPSPLMYTGTGVFSKAYSQPFAYYPYTFQVPPGVTRIKCFVVGGGGGGHGDAVNKFGGGGAEHREGIIQVTPGSNLSVIVGAGGAPVFNSASPAGEGGVSAVSTGAAYIEAANGSGATNAAPGVANVGAVSSSVLNLLLAGAPGTNTGLPGASGSYFGNAAPFINGNPAFGEGGKGGTTSPTTTAGTAGLVILEWIK